MAHWLFHVANCCLFVSYLSPSVLFLRLALSTACAFLVAWGSSVLDNDIATIVYNTVFLAINLAHAIRIMLAMRPVPLDPEYERLYEHFCSRGSLRLSRSAFHSLVSGKTVTQRQLKPGEIFSEPNQPATSLNILLKGRMAVYERTSSGAKIFLHSLCEFDLIDSPEFVLQSAVGASIAADPASLPAKRKGPMYRVYIETWSGGTSSQAELPPSPSVATLAEQSEGSKSPIVAPPHIQAQVDAGTRASIHMPPSGATVLSIPYPHLAALTAENPQLGAVIDALVSMDVTSKLRWISQRLADTVVLTPAQQAGVIPSAAPIGGTSALVKASHLMLPDSSTATISAANTASTVVSAGGVLASPTSAQPAIVTSSANNLTLTASEREKLAAGHVRIDVV